jgi:hypothetical protein
MLKQKKTTLIIITIFFVFIIKSYYIYTSFVSTDFTEKVAYNNADAGHFLSIARNIHNFHVFSEYSSTIPSESATWRPPIWPFLLSFLFIFSDSIFWILISKLILETLLIIGIIYFYKKKTTINWYLLFPLLVLFIEPQYLKYSLTFNSESINSILILILTIFFLTLKPSKKFNLLIPILSAAIVICHPVSAFFVVTFMGIYCILNLKTNFKISFIHGFIFVVLLSIWPIRNAITFNKGFFVTASQGATFSKGWNETVVADFTNVDGDLADEGINLKYIKNRKIKQPVESILDLSELYKEGTENYINGLSFSQKAAIVLKKIKSNFNPFPEKPKPGFFEDLSILFRVFYLLLFIQLFIRLSQTKKFDFNSHIDKAFLVVISIFIGQIIMASYIYTGFRFNTIYSLTLLFCFIIVNNGLIQKVITKISRISKIREFMKSE